MIFGSHVILFSTDAEADRAFLADVLGTCRLRDAAPNASAELQPPSRRSGTPEVEIGVLF
jgi:hypothetical protein